ncbi:MAG: DUF2442 domain-containing protein [Clostridiales bacterium]|nr:DUF2442 domain-containing protein [Clostridiales bacterium]
MSHIIKSINTNDNLCIEAMFLDGTVKQYDLHNMFAVYPKMKELEKKDLFDTAKVDAGGYGIFWNDELDLDAETIWAEGVTVREVPTDTFSRLAANLAEARKFAGVTQKQLSEKTGIYQSDISRIEHGQANPSVSTLQRLADGMNMELNIGFTAKK